MMGFSCENSKQLEAVNYFRQKSIIGYLVTYTIAKQFKTFK